MLITVKGHVEMVTVYYFEKYDIVTDKIVRSKRPATLETITKYQGQAVLSTACEIDDSQLDSDGFRKRES